MTATRWCRRCGWKGTYTSAAKGNYAKRLHSCEKQLAKAASAARGAKQRATLDRTPKPCLHPIANHQHGTYACYTLDSCRCRPCAGAQHRYEQNRTRTQAYGRWDNLVDAEPARAHIRSLMNQGMGLKRIVLVSDLSQGALWKLIYGRRGADGIQRPTKRIRKDTEARALAVRLDLADGAIVPSTPTVLRMRALVALGWSQAKLAHRLGIRPSNFYLARGRWQITAETARRAADLYDELSMVPPPEDNQRDRIAASRSRRYARDHGWLPPLALDDDHLDDPAYEPTLEPPEDADDVDQAVIERHLAGDPVPATDAERTEIVRIWRQTGRPMVDLERLVSWNIGRYAAQTKSEPAA